MSVPLRTSPRRVRFRRADVYRLAEQGWFRGRRVELCAGHLVEIPPQSNHHAASVQLTCDALRRAFGDGFWVRQRSSLDLGPYSVLDPDLAVVPGTPRDSGPHHPTTALLVVEVGDGALRYQQGRKAAIYAAAGIADYWIVILAARTLEVRRRPVPNERRYAECSRFAPADTVSPLAAPHATITVADLLP